MLKILKDVIIIIKGLGAMSVGSKDWSFKKNKAKKK